jgi:hypothetical protein
MEGMKSFWERLRNHFVPHRDNAYRPYLLRRGWMVFFLALVLATEGFLVASLVARQSGGSFLASVIAGDLILLTNEARAAQNDTQLSDNAALDAAAQAKADDMAAKGYFAHVGPDGKEPWDWIAGAGYDYQYAGENLAVRFIDSKDVVDAWMASPTHRANILKPVYRDIGIGIAEGVYKGAPATYVVQYFGAAARAPGQVLGVQIGAAPQNAVDTVVRQSARIISDPRQSSLWILGGIAALLVFLVGLTFLFHIQLQARDLLLPGVAVASVALFLFAFNVSVLPAREGQSAAAIQSVIGPQGVVVDTAAASTQR